MHRFLLLLTLVLIALTLTGCSQEPALETLDSASEGDYRYLSRAIGEHPVSTPTVSGKSNQTTSHPSPSPSENPSLSRENTPTSTLPSAPTPVPSPDNAEPSPSPTEEDFPLLEEYDRAVIQTSKGSFTLKFYNDDAPKTVNNFLKLAEEGFYDDLRFHRVIKGFIIQTGDPNSRNDDPSDDGTGGPGYTFPDEINSHKIVEGSVAMANSGPDTNGSQFFILTASSAPLLDGKYTCFGEVIDGMEVVRKIEKTETDTSDHPKEDIFFQSVKLLKKE